MEKVPTKKLLGISAIVWGITTIVYVASCALNYGEPSYNKFVNTVLLSAADPDSNVGVRYKNIPAGNEDAVKMGKIIRAKYDQGISPEQLTELSREMRPFVEKKLESLAIQDISAIFKTLPADLDTAKSIASLSASSNWLSLMGDSRDKTRLLQVLKREKTGPEAVNSKNFFRIDKYVYILITQAVGFLIYILIFYTDRVYPQFGESY
ncbi:MAG: hypothetical protein Q8R29_03190, partial [bacterium]|nr:hypothetical protein [bacterium]